jgi:hypothetical protein
MKPAAAKPNGQVLDELCRGGVNKLYRAFEWTFYETRILTFEHTLERTH